MSGRRIVEPAGWSRGDGPPYSPGVEAGGFVFVSGQLPLDRGSGEMVAGSIAAQTRQALANLERVLAAAGTGFDDLVQVRAYLLRRSDWAEMNAAYRAIVGAPAPARCVVVVPELAPGAEVEIEAVALARGES